MSDLKTTDVFIVGGGPAGLAAAIAARANGLSAAVADLATPPFEKVCGEGLMPDAVASLHTLGVTIPSVEGSSFDGIRFLDGKQSVEADFPRGTGVGIRRPVLHQLLANHAHNVGVSLCWGARVTRNLNGDIEVNGSIIRARYVIGADGHRSRVRRWACLHQRSQSQTRFGFRRHYEITPWTNRVEVYWGTDFQFVITPVGPRQVSVALLTRKPGFRIADALPQFPGLQLRLQSASPITVERGTISAMATVRSVCRDRFALVGDASGSVDPITGEGLRLAFQQALFLGKAMAADHLQSYQKAHRHIARLPMWMSRLMLRMDRSALIRKSAMCAFAAYPQSFAKVLAIHTGDNALPTKLSKTTRNFDELYSAHISL